MRIVVDERAIVVGKSGECVDNPVEAAIAAAVGRPVDVLEGAFEDDPEDVDARWFAMIKLDERPLHDTWCELPGDVGQWIERWERTGVGGAFCFECRGLDAFAIDQPKQEETEQ